MTSEKVRAWARCSRTAGWRGRGGGVLPGEGGVEVVLVADDEVGEERVGRDREDAFLEVVGLGGTQGEVGLVEEPVGRRWQAGVPVGGIALGGAAVVTDERCGAGRQREPTELLLPLGHRAREGADAVAAERDPSRRRPAAAACVPAPPGR